MKQANSLSLTLWFPLLVAFTFLISCLMLVWVLRSDLESTLVENSMLAITRDMASLQHEMESNFSTGHLKSANRALSFRGLNPQYNTLAAIDQNGRIMHASQLALKAHKAGMVLPDFDPKRFIQLQRGNQTDIRFEPEHQKIIAYFPLALARRAGEIRPLRTGALFLVYDLSIEQAQIWGDVWRSSWPAGLGLLLVMIILIQFLHYFVTLPIQHLVATADALDEDDSKIRSNIQGSGELVRLGAAFNDMAERLKHRNEQRQRAEQTNRNQEQLVKDLLNSTAEAIYGLDTSGICTFANPPCLQMLGYRDADELIGRNMHQLVHYKRADGSPNPVDESPIFSTFISGRSANIDTDVLWRRDGTNFPAEYWSHPIRRDDTVIGAVVTFIDTSERKQAEQKILHQAHFDALTDLPNRFLSLDRLTQLIKEAKRDQKSVAVLFLDLDDFKKINDTLGHEAGDKLLVESAKRLSKGLRNGDTVGRLGGDEFIVLLPGLATTADISPVADKLLKLFGEAFSIDGRELMLSASIGIAIYPGDGESPSTLLRNADSAMYHAKASGRNNYSFFTLAMNRKVSRRLELEEQIHGALERGEFQVHYQPQVNIFSSQVIGAEALLRWHNPALGQVSPEEFIPIAEQTGLIVTIGQFVLIEALTMTARWQSQLDSNFRIAVNLSPRQIRDPELVSFIEQTLRQSQVSAEDLELEITEGVLMSNQIQIDQALAALSELGVSIAMDDFGTGYSSLSYLRSYPFNILKIDRSFINDMTTSSADRELVNAAIAMAHGLGLKVVAEGVETDQQFRELKQLGCDYAQGYLLGKPVAAEEFLLSFYRESDLAGVV
ncbi:EAL domain-containing protein [Amphritea sp. HPY]|uniref:EAL domain-containing protein n=1 Tax=Amphritea sp. HPY TaxID=3421652 RepID=UPI003D7C71EB